MEDLPHGAGVAVPQQSTGGQAVLTALRSSHVSPPIPRCSILSLSIHTNMTSASIHWIPGSNSWKTWRGIVRPTPAIIHRCSQLTLQVPDTL
jgi:hypothetical protein